ncbi:hypothetical protein ABIB40_004178 [Pedobacter sp. UYP30]|uniref:hypothetical protein n=1 Tax=Pedobacter sp. UYP30 TaxID=1756400 RepID=UPI0033991889
MKIFLFDPEWDYELNDYDASIEEALEAFYDLPDVKGAFFGLIDSEDRFVQFAWSAQDKWIIDIPAKSYETSGASFQILGSYENCIEIINAMYNELQVDQLQELMESKTFFRR